jgi:hypothetical protein
VLGSKLKIWKSKFNLVYKLLEKKKKIEKSKKSTPKKFAELFEEKTFCHTSM